MRVSEGDQYRVGRLEFAGNSRTRDKVLRREFRVQEGHAAQHGRSQEQPFQDQPAAATSSSTRATRSRSRPSTPRRRRSTCCARPRSPTAPSCRSAAAGASRTASSASSRCARQNFLGRGETLGVSFQSGRYRRLVQPLLRHSLVPRPPAVDRGADLQLERRLHPAQQLPEHPEGHGRHHHLRPIDRFLPEFLGLLQPVRSHRQGHHLRRDRKARSADLRREELVAPAGLLDRDPRQPRGADDRQVLLGLGRVRRRRARRHERLRAARGRLSRCTSR